MTFDSKYKTLLIILTVIAFFMILSLRFCSNKQSFKNTIYPPEKQQDCCLSVQELENKVYTLSNNLLDIKKNIEEVENKIDEVNQKSEQSIKYFELENQKLKYKIDITIEELVNIRKRLPVKIQLDKRPNLPEKEKSCIQNSCQ